MTGRIVLIAVGLGLRHAVAPDHLAAIPSPVAGLRRFFP